MEMILQLRGVLTLLRIFVVGSHQTILLNTHTEKVQKDLSWRGVNENWQQITEACQRRETMRVSLFVSKQFSTFSESLYDNDNLYEIEFSPSTLLFAIHNVDTHSYTHNTLLPTNWNFRLINPHLTTLLHKLPEHCEGWKNMAFIPIRNQCEWKMCWNSKMTWQWGLDRYARENRVKAWRSTW